MPLMHLAVILPDWSRVEFDATSYEVFADGSLTVHFEDGGVQPFSAGQWVDVHRVEGPG